MECFVHASVCSVCMLFSNMMYYVTGFQTPRAALCALYLQRHTNVVAYKQQQGKYTVV